MSDDSLRTFERAVAIVTGGASGIGRALAEELANRGAEVVAADLQIELAREVADGIRHRGGEAESVKVNVADFAEVYALVQKTVKRAGRLDYMVNNAGIAIGGEARALQREHEAVRYFARPFAEALRLLRAVMGAVDLDRGQLGGGVGQLLRLRELFGVKHAAPRRERPTAYAEIDVT